MLRPDTSRLKIRRVVANRCINISTHEETFLDTAMWWKKLEELVRNDPVFIAITYVMNWRYKSRGYFISTHEETFLDTAMWWKNKFL